MAKEKEFNLTVRIAFQPAHEQTHHETQAAVYGSKDQGPAGW